MPNLSYNVSGIKNRGGKTLAIRRVNSDGTQIAGENWFDFGAKEKTSIMFEKALAEFKDEHGDIVASEDGDVKTELKVTGMQSDSATMNFLVTQTDGTYFACCVHTGEGLGTTSQFCYIPVTRAQVGFSINYPGRRPEVTFKPQSPVSSWNGNSLTAGTVSSWATNYGTSNPATLSGSLTGAAGTYMTFAEV